MCIRDRSNGVRVNLKPTEFDKDSINITFAVDGGEPVSYTHLDVYKRQALMRSNTIDSAFSALASSSVKMPRATSLVMSMSRLVVWLSLIHI